jgi:hypothetical protein
MDIDDLSPAHMKSLLLKCHNEQRPPRADELRLWKPAVSARHDTGLFDLMDDDLLTETLVRLPIKRRILFVTNLSKQFAYLVKERKLFRTLYLVRKPMSLPRHLVEDEDVLLNVTDKVGSWRLFADSLEELFIACDPIDKSLSRTPDEFDKWLDRPLKNLVSLSLIGVHVKKVTPFIDPIKLKVLKLRFVKCGPEINDVRYAHDRSYRSERIKLLDAADAYERSYASEAEKLLKAACNLERLTVRFYIREFPKILDSWWTAHGGVPPLRYLCTQNTGMVKLSLQRLDLEELVAISHTIGRCRITKGAHPNQWTLSVTLPNLDPLQVQFYQLLQQDTGDDLNWMLMAFTTLLQCIPGLSAHVTVRYYEQVQCFVDPMKAKLLDRFPHLTFATEKIA